MKAPSLRSLRLAIVVALVVVMPNQLAYQLRLGGVALPVAPADVLLALAFASLLIHLVTRGRRGFRLPPLAAVAFAAAALLALLPCRDRLAAAKEVAQVVEYFIVGFLVFVNIEETGDVKPLIWALVAATGIVVLWAAADYFRFGTVGPLDVKAGYVNRNALGAFLAMSIPAIYGLALHLPRWPARLGLLVLVGLGLLTNLSGGALLATLVAMTAVSALRGPRTLVAHVCLLGLLSMVAPGLLPRPYHTDTLASSIALKVNDNFLLSDRAMVARARELFKPTREIVVDHSGERKMPEPRPLDAERLLNLLNARRPLRKDELALVVQIKGAIGKTVPEDQVANYPLKTPQVAVRYQRWNAALLALRNLWHTRQPETLRGNPLTGYGLKPYHEIVNPFMPDRLQYRTDEPEVFNVAAPEPMTHNVWLKTAAQSGLLGLLSLVWLVGHFLGRATRLHGAAHSDLMLGLALAVVGGVSGFALAGIFTENIARGLAPPFVFLCSLVVLGERIVHGEPQKPRWELSRYD